LYFQDSLEDLKKPWGKGSWVTDGYCNCNQCEKSNVSLVVDVTVSALQCPKDTRYCFQVESPRSLFLNIFGDFFCGKKLANFVAKCLRRV
jgi:hypothetical protein